MRLHESAHCSTASPLSSVLVYPHVVLWLFPCPSTGSTNFSFGGLYTECTTIPGISIEISSTLSCSHTDMPFSVTSDENSATIPDVGSLSYECLALLKDFGSLASWISVRSHESAHCSTASPLLSVVS